MADLAVGLAKSVVEGTLSKAQAAIAEEAKLRESAQSDLVFITGEFQMMQSFLKVANAERVENPVVMTWVRQIRELAYDVEDCIEFVVHLDKKSSWWWRMVPGWCVSVTMPLDEAVDEIEQLKARVADVSTRNARYSLISDTGSKPVVVQQQPAPGAAVGGATASNMLAEARDTAKRQEKVLGGGDLTHLITDKRVDHDQLQVISVWGSAGDHGATSIIMNAYNDPEIRKDFTYRAWVRLVNPFSPDNFVRGLMSQFYANSFKESTLVGMHVLNKMKASQDDLFAEFERLVTTERYLVVLEGLSSMVEWHAIRTFLPHRETCSRIIVSTDQTELASLCIQHSYQILELKHFSPEHSVCALFKKSSHGDKDKGKKSMVKDCFLVGRESQMNELHKYPANARLKSSQVMSVWGIAGVGKSALVRDLYIDLYNNDDSRLLEEKQFNKYCWVDVSHPFNLRDFCRNLLSDYQSEKDPIKECRRLLERHRCLIVIDDIISKKEWDLIKTSLVPTSSMSVIIVITTDASIAAYCTNSEDLVFNVKGLEADAAFRLFKDEVRRRNPSSPLKDHNEAKVEELILKCGGLPKVIVAIAGVLEKQTVTWMDTVVSLNQRFMHHLETNTDYDTLRDLFGWMHSYFRTCPDSLKPCIFYLSIFPQGQIVRRRRLVRRWIAEGYSRDGDVESAEENGEKHYSELLDLSIIQQVPQLVTQKELNEKKMVLCQVNGFIREYIIPRRKEENLVFELGGSCALTSQRTGRHLIIMDDWERDIVVFESIDFSRLRSLTVFGKWESFFISESMKLLRVLDLEDASGHVEYKDLEKMVKWLRRLKFFSLRGRREIYHLPSSLGHLRQLQTLDVRHTSIVTLPNSITKLQKLQYIRAGTRFDRAASLPPSSSCSWFCSCGRHIVGVQVPRGLGALTTLHTLGVVNVSVSGGEVFLEELKKLTQLRKLGVSGINKHNNSKFFSAISGHSHLESLSVRLDKGHEGCLDAMNSLLFKNVQSLKLYGLENKLPVSIESKKVSGKHKSKKVPSDQFSKLRKLVLEMGTLKDVDIEFLAKVPKLSILRLRVKQTSLHFYAELYKKQLPTYKRVKILEISCSSNSLHITFGSSSMQSLELLRLDCSSGLSYRLSGLNYLCELKQVLLTGTKDETLKTNLQKELLNHPKKPDVKLEELSFSF